MTPAAKLAKLALDRIMNLKKYRVRLRMAEFSGHGVMPFDLTIRNDIATVDLLATDMQDARRQVSEYFGSSDWVD